MASLHQRNRIVVFRLSQEEYNRLRSACLVAGGRNLSDYTRTELLSSLRSDSRDSLIEQKFRELERKLSDLHDMMRSVSEQICLREPNPKGSGNSA
jgi:hypothetical protein